MDVDARGRESLEVPARVVERGLVARLAVPVAVLGLVGSLSLLGWTWRHPTLFEADALAYGFEQRPVGQRVYVGMTPAVVSAPGPVTLEDIRPVLRTNTAEAEIAFFVCTLDPTRGIGSVGAVRSLGRACSGVTPVRAGTTFDADASASPRQQVVMAIEPTAPGLVVIDGMKVTYAAGWQRGSQWIGPHVMVETVD